MDGIKSLSELLRHNKIIMATLILCACQDMIGRSNCFFYLLYVRCVLEYE